MLRIKTYTLRRKESSRHVFLLRILYKGIHLKIIYYIPQMRMHYESGCFLRFQLLH